MHRHRPSGSAITLFESVIEYSIAYYRKNSNHKVKVNIIWHTLKANPIFITFLPLTEVCKIKSRLIIN